MASGSALAAQRAVEELADLGVADRREAGGAGAPAAADAARLVDEAAGEHDVDARGDARLERSRGGSSSMTSIGWRGAVTWRAWCSESGHPGQRMHLERAHQPHQVGGGDARGRARDRRRAA